MVFALIFGNLATHSGAQRDTPHQRRRHTSRLPYYVGLVLFTFGALPYCVSQQKTIHLAAREGDAASVRTSLERDLSPDSYGSFAEAPLHAAAARGHLAVVEVLLDFGANRNILTKDTRRRTALHLAAVNGRTEIIRALLEYRPSLQAVDANIQDDLGNTPLHEAAIFGSQSMIDALVDYGVDITILNDNNQTALDICEGEECVVKRGNWVTLRIPVGVTQLIPLEGVQITEGDTVLSGGIEFILYPFYADEKDRNLKLFGFGLELGLFLSPLNLINTVAATPVVGGWGGFEARLYALTLDFGLFEILPYAGLGVTMQTTSSTTNILLGLQAGGRMALDFDIGALYLDAAYNSGQREASRANLKIALGYSFVVL